MSWWSRPYAGEEMVPASWPVLRSGASEFQTVPDLPGEADEGQFEAWIESEVRERTQAVAKEAHAEGFAEGVKAGEEALARARLERAALEEEIGEWREWAERSARRLEEAALDLARDLAEAALFRELDDPGEQVLAEATSLLAAREGAKVLKVAPGLAAPLAAKLATAHPGVPVEPDAAVAPGDAVVQQEDATVMTGPTWRWRRLVEALGQEVTSRGRV